MDRVPRPLIEEIEDDLLPLVEERRDGALLTILVDLHPADIASLIALLTNEEDRRYVFELLRDRETASDVLTELPAPVREHLLETIPSEEIADLVEEMSSDDAADLVQELPEQLAERVLREVHAEEREAVRPLLQYDSETAGGIMASEVLAVHEAGTIDDALREVRRRAEDLEPVFYVYVVDDATRLVGVLSFRQLVVHPGNVLVGEVMDREPVVVPPDMDQEQVAEMFRRYDLMAVPVVDASSVLLGRITVDDVVDVLREEAEEDIARMAGTDEEEFHETSVRRIVFYRLPWILASLTGGFLAGIVLHRFASEVSVGVALVTFVPAIMAMGGNAGSQAAITMVRRIALRHVDRREVFTIVWREARVGLALGVITGLAMGAAALLLEGAWYYGVVVGVSMAMAILMAVAMGSLTPLLFRKMKVDPAIATGPFVTMTNDATGLLIYFGLAVLLLRFFGTGT